jgi:hypothetical protein
VGVYALAQRRGNITNGSTEKSCRMGLIKSTIWLNNNCHLGVHAHAQRRGNITNGSTEKSCRMGLIIKNINN